MNAFPVMQKMKALLPLQYNHYVILYINIYILFFVFQKLLPILAFSMQIDIDQPSYFKNIQLILQPSNQEIIWMQEVQIHPVVMHKHAPSQREGEENYR